MATKRITKSIDINDVLISEERCILSSLFKLYGKEVQLSGI